MCGEREGGKAKEERRERQDDGEDEYGRERGGRGRHGWSHEGDTPTMGLGIKKTEAVGDGKMKSSFWARRKERQEEGALNF